MKLITVTILFGFILICAFNRNSVDGKPWRESNIRGNGKYNWLMTFVIAFNGRWIYFLSKGVIEKKRIFFDCFDEDKIHEQFVGFQDQILFNIFGINNGSGSSPEEDTPNPTVDDANDDNLSAPNPSETSSSISPSDADTEELDEGTTTDNNAEEEEPTTISNSVVGKDANTDVDHDDAVIGNEPNTEV